MKIRLLQGIVPSTNTLSFLCCSLYTDFICWRGLLTKLLCTPYEQRDGWEIAVSSFNGTLYMCEFDSEQRLQQQAEQTDALKEMSYWGLKFEQYVTAGQLPSM